MLNHNQNLFLIVSACLASLQKFLKGKSDAYEQLICIVQRVPESVFSIVHVNKS